MAETFYAGDKIRKYYGKGDLSEIEENGHYEKVIEKYPWVSNRDYVAISTPVFHPILREEFVSGLLPAGQKNILFGKSYIRAYKILLESEIPYLSWLPANSSLIAVGENHAEFGRPAPTGIETFKDYYFGGDPDIVEQQFGLEKRRGQYETYYGATCIGNEVIELKQYCYDTQELLSDWDVYAVLARREREVGTYGDEQLNIDYQIAMETLNSKNTNTSS